MPPVTFTVARCFAMATLLPVAATSVAAQTPPRPGQIPYLNFQQIPSLAAPSTTTPSITTPSAQPNPAIAPSGPAVQNPGSAAPAQPTANLDTVKEREKEFESIRAEQRRALDNEARLKHEIESIGDDRRKLNQQVIDAAARVRTVEDEIAKIEDRLTPLDDRERTLHQSLAARREVVAKVLAALQRMGRQPPPALLVNPEDALRSVRAAMLLGAVLPAMRHETEAVVADLAELVALRKSIAEERAGRQRDLKALAEERLRLALLIEQRQKQQADTEKILAAERQRAAQLARKAENLRDLIASLEQSIDEATRAARDAASKKALESSRPALAALKDPGRLAPAVAFASARGLLPLPVNGVKIRDFGAADGLGGTEKGVSLASRPGAQVTAPCDGWVVFAGPFRNYGQLLILNAGGGYHVLLAGVDRISVDLGQFVLTGEPVAVMGGTAQSTAAIAIGSSQPVLYVEFRKDGSPVDPSPWWAASEGEKVRG
jgi:septal ring factor EnvC (AmiA/AmiB activator)